LENLLQILEEIKYNFKKEIEDLKISLEEEKRTEEEIGSELKE